MRPLHSLAIVALLLAGCASPEPTGTAGSPNVPVSDDAASTAVASQASVSSDSEFGAIGGLVRDVLGAPLEGVRVGLVNIAQEGLTDNRGEFFLDQVEPGPYMLRAQKAGYEPAATTLDVVAGTRSDVKITLAADTRPPALADFWRGRERVTVADSDFAGQDNLLANQCISYLGDVGSRWQGPPLLRFDDPHQLVWPGTASIEVVLDWPAASYTGDEMMVIWRPHPHAQWQTSPMTPKGEVIRIEVQPSEADSPHQRFTAWQLAVCTKDQGSSPTQYTKHFAGTLHATITLVRGHPLPLLEPEADLWGNLSRIRLVDEAKHFSATDPANDPYFAVMAPCNGVTDRTTTAPEVNEAFEETWTFAVFEGLLVPARTDRIEAWLEWHYGAEATGGPDLFLSYRDASIAPWVPVDPALETTPKVNLQSPGVRFYSFSVPNEVLDGADDVETAWRFFWNMDGMTPLCSGLDVRLVVEAVRAN